MNLSMEEDGRIEIIKNTNNTKTFHFIRVDIAILLFPCSQFGESMAESTNSEIYCWCKFDGVADYAHIFGRVNVAGEKISPLFKFLTDGSGVRVSSNFTKFIINDRGQVCSRHENSSTLKSIVEAINSIVWYKLNCLFSCSANKNLHPACWNEIIEFSIFAEAFVSLSIPVSLSAMPCDAQQQVPY